jgi:DNA-binding MarR family transcriptional regulator
METSLVLLSADLRGRRSPVSSRGRLLRTKGSATDTPGAALNEKRTIMRTVAATRQTHRPDLTSKPQALTWLVYCRENKLLTASEWALAAILVTCGQGQNITLSVTGMADILHMKRSTVSDAIGGLVAKGLMVEKGRGRNNKTFYRLTLPKAPATDRMGTSHCPNRDQSLPESGPVDCPNGDHNIEDIQEEVDEEATSTSARGAGADAVATAASGSTRTKEGAPALDVEDYVEDTRANLKELAYRLGIEADDIEVFRLSRKLYQMGKRYSCNARLSVALEVFGDDLFAGWATAKNPVGWMTYYLEENLSLNHQDDEGDT